MSIDPPSTADLALSPTPLAQRVAARLMQPLEALSAALLTLIVVLLLVGGAVWTESWD